MSKFLQMLRNNKGATAIEYGLIAALIAVAGVTAFTALGSQIGTTMSNAASKMKTSS